MAKKLTDPIGAKIVPVAVRDRPVVEDLELIASENKVIRTQMEDYTKIGKKLLRGTCNPFTQNSLSLWVKSLNCDYSNMELSICSNFKNALTVI